MVSQQDTNDINSISLIFHLFSEFHLGDLRDGLHDRPESFEIPGTDPLQDLTLELLPRPPCPPPDAAARRS